MDPPMSSLRRLSGEIARFRSSDVQAALARAEAGGTDDGGRTSPRNQATPPSSSPPPAEMYATLLELRAELATAVSERDAASADVVRADARRAAAEVARDDAERGRQVAQNTSDAEAAASKSLIARLSRERKMLAEDSAQKSLLLHRKGLGEAPGAATPISSWTAVTPNGHRPSPDSSHYNPPSQSSPSQRAVASAERLGRELEVAKAEAQANSLAYQAERSAREDRMASLEHQLADMRAARAHVDSGKIAMTRDQSAREAALRTELVATKVQLAKSIEELNKSRAERSRAESKLLALEGRTRCADASAEELSMVKEKLAALQMTTANPDTSSVTVATLKKEVSQMAIWIRALSPSGSSLEQGLAILRAAAADRVDHAGTNVSSAQPLQAASVSATSNEVQQQRIVFARLNTRIAELCVQIENSKRDLIQVTAERDELKHLHERSERMRQLLERKSKHLQLAIEEIERGIETGNDDDAHALQRAQEYANVAAEQAREYKAVAEKFELSLRELEAEVRDLSRQAASHARWDAGPSGDMDSTIGGLRSQLMEAIREASVAAQGRETAEKRLITAEASLREAKQQVVELSRENAAQLDYDPVELKVLRSRLGPLHSETLLLEYKDRVPKRRRIEKEHMEGVGAGEGSTEDLEVRIRELEERNRELEQLSKLGERTKEIAKRKIEEVRQACCVLFGWTMRINGATYKLSSIYAEDREDELEFGVLEGGGMALHENGYAMRIQDEVDQLVSKWKSIPALLASLTFSNFEKTTLITGQ
jgi:Mitotic checkpoint protein